MSTAGMLVVRQVERSGAEECKVTRTNPLACIAQASTGLASAENGHQVDADARPRSSGHDHASTSQAARITTVTDNTLAISRPIVAGIHTQEDAHGFFSRILFSAFSSMALMRSTSSADRPAFQEREH